MMRMTWLWARRAAAVVVTTLLPAGCADRAPPADAAPARDAAPTDAPIDAPTDAVSDAAHRDDGAAADAGPQCPEPPARELWVDARDPAASDEGDGSATRPLRTIARALAIATAGTRIRVQPGEYREHLSTQRSGEPCRPIVLEGARDAAGARLAVIDPSQPLTTGWVPAPEIGPGVYRRANVGPAPMVITIDNRYIGRITDANMRAGGPGWDALRRGPSETVTVPTGTAGFWDGVEAVFGTAGTTTYFRMRSGNNPATLALRASTNGATAVERGVREPAVYVRHAYVTVRGFSIRGAYHGIAVGTDAAHHVVIEDNRVGGGYARVDISNGAHDVLVRGNELASDYYGYAGFGAWRAPVDEHVYETFKLLFGPNTSADTGVDGGNAGDRIAIEANEIHHGMLGVSLGGRGTGTLRVVGNHLHDLGSVGITMSETWRTTHVAGNRLANINIALRVQDLNRAGVVERSVYVYRNRSHQPGARGRHLFLHALDPALASSAPTVAPGELWFYANSFTGGDHGVAPNAYVDAVGGLPRAFLLDNVLDCDLPLVLNTRQRGAGFVGGFARNVLSGWTVPMGTVAWIDLAQNPSSNAPLWPRDTATDFVLPAGHAGVDSGIDFAQPFTLGGAVRGPLPDLPDVPVRGAGRDIGAVER